MILSDVLDSTFETSKVSSFIEKVALYCQDKLIIKQNKTNRMLSI